MRKKPRGRKGRGRRSKRGRSKSYRGYKVSRGGIRL